MYRLADSSQSLGCGTVTHFIVAPYKYYMALVFIQTFLHENLSKVRVFITLTARPRVMDSPQSFTLISLFNAF